MRATYYQLEDSAQVGAVGDGATTVPIANPQTWSRLRRVEARDLAQQVANQALKRAEGWVSNEDGRALKVSMDAVSLRLGLPARPNEIETEFADLLFAASEFRTLLDNRFFKTWLANEELIGRHRISRPARLVLADAIREIDENISSYKSKIPPPLTELQQAQRLVPDQKIGPVRFKFLDGSLKVDHQPAKAGSAEIVAAESAREELVAAGKALISELAQTNVDPRLIDILSDMQQRLIRRQDVIQLGLSALTCQMVLSGTLDEVAVVHRERIRAYSAGLGMYVAQFSEWIRFSDNAAIANFSAEDVSNLYASGRTMVDRLRSAGSTVDPEVPRTLAFLLEAIRDPQRAVKRTVFAAIRTIENLVSAVFKACGKFINASVDGLSDGAGSASKLSVQVALLIVAANAAVDISPAAGRILQTHWLAEAGKIILKELGG